MKKVYLKFRIEFYGFLLLGLLLSVSGFSQVTFLGDNWQAKRNPLMSNLTNVGSITYFSTGEMNYYTNKAMPKLWKTDGTEAGTIELGTALMDSLVASASSNVSLVELVDFNGNCFFTTSTGALCKSDGTNAGTIAIRDFNYISNLTAVNGLLFFTADDGIHGKELWKTDGTLAGTQMVKDIYVEFTPITGSNPGSFFAFGNTLIFVATTPDYGVELWKSDGTEAGTQMIKDIRSGSAGISGVDATNGMIVFGGSLYLSLNDGNTGAGLWKTDGTAAGTVQVKDINGIYLYNFYEKNGDLYFTAYTGSTTFWKSDGTTAGTIQISYVAGGGAAYNGNFYYVDNSNNLWKTNGSPGNESLFKENFDVIAFVGVIDSKLIMLAESRDVITDGPERGFELWQIDGTTVSRLTDLHPGSRDAVEKENPQYIMNGAQFYFVGNDGTGYSLWKSNGTTAGTVKVKSPSVFGNTKFGANEIFTYTKADLGDKVLFPILNTTGEVWQSDGTPAGTTIIEARETSGEYKSNGNKVYVRTESDVYPGNHSIYSISGTPLAMTEIVASVQSTGIGAIHPQTGKLIFSSANSNSLGNIVTSGNEPWVTDGTEAGTFRLKDIVPGGGPWGDSDPGNYFTTNSLVYFTAAGALYKTDGTIAGTQEVFPEAISSGAKIGELGIFGAGAGIYKTDGTSGGTNLIKALSSVPKILSEFENSVVFWQGGAWITDGTEAGTIQLTSSYTEEPLSNFYRIGSLIYFIQRDKLYQTDGTMSGTTQILTNVKEMTKFDNKIFLTRESETAGQSIITFYIFDGEINTMVEVPGSSTIQEIADLHTNSNNLFFYGFEDNTGYELYTYNIPANPTFSIRYQSGTTISTIENGFQIDPTSIASNLNIGEAELGQSVTKEKYVISNTGNSALTLGTPTFTGSYAQYFAFENFPQSIAPFTVDSFNIVFTGNSHDGVEIAGVQIPTNDPDRPVFTFEVSGKSKSRPVMQLLNYNILSGPLDYGPVVLNQSKNDTIIICNTGRGNPLTFDSLVFSGSAKDEFTVVVSNQSIKPYFVHSILPVDQSDSLYNNPAFSSDLKIIFTPTVSGARNATLTIYSNDTAYTGTQAIPLTGEGVCMPADSISPATTDLICLDSGEEVTLTYPQSPNETYCWGTYTDWSFVGLENNLFAYSFASKLKFDSNNTPVLAVNTPAGLSVLKYENDAWTYVGGAGFATTSSTHNKSIDLEIGANDALYVSYINSSHKASVKKFDGTNWVSVGSDGFSDGLVEFLSMTLSDGKATVVYMDKSAFNRAMVKQFDGTNWVTVGSNGFTLASAKYLDIESYANQLYVSMQDGSDLQGGASLYKYNGTSWDVVGTKGFSDGGISATDLEFDSNGNPIVVYAKIIYSGQQVKFTVKKFENNSWQAIGNTLFPEYKSINASEFELGLTISNNVPYVAYLSNNTLLVMSAENGEWNVLGAESLPQKPTTSYVFSSDLAVDNTGVLHCYYNGNSYFNLIKYVDSFNCLGTDNTYTTSTAGFYKVLITNSQTNCTVQSLNTVEVRTKKCVPILRVYGKGNIISIGDNTPSIDDNTQMGNTSLNTPVTREFILTNTGDGSLVFSSPISFTGANAARFSIVDQPGPIPAGSSDTITVQYQSDAYEISTATLQMATNNVPLNGSYYFDVQAQTSGLSLSLTDALLTDLNNNGFVDDNDVIRYTGTLENTAGAPTVNNVVITARTSSKAIASFVDGSFTTTVGTIGGYSFRPTVSIASLTAGTTATIQYDMLISEAWGQYYPGVINQMDMTAANMLTIYSDDPYYPGNNDPTLTPYEPQCTNPTDGGTIGIAQTICSGATPLTINNITLPSGEVGTLAYKWQSSTTSATAGFSDIAASNSESYAPGALTATTWYKRLAIVDCSTDWTGAVESNVISITVPTVAIPVLTIQSNTATTATTSTANGTITQACVNATNRGAIWYAYTDSDKEIGGTDVTNVDESGDFGETTFTATLTGLTANTRYDVRAHATNPDGTGYSGRTDFWTLANVPAAPTIDGATATSLDVTVNVNGNPASTEFVIAETSTGKFVQANGSLNTTPVWQTAAAWGGITVNSLTTGTTYTFKVKARNGDNIETDFSSDAQGTPVAAPTVTTQATSVIAATTATGNGTISNTNGGNATNRGAIWYPYTDTDKAIGDADVTNVDEIGDFGTGVFTALFTTLDVNTQYNTRAHATNQYGTGYGERESFWTLANVPAAPTVDGATATSLDVTVNVNGNPAYTEFCINETSTSKFVQNDGTLGAFPFSQTGTQWGTITVNGLTTGLTYTFKVQAYNGADVATVFGDGTQGTPVAAPTVTTQATSVIAATTATGNGTISNTNGGNATNRGAIWYPYTDTDKAIGDVDVTNVDENGNIGTGVFTALFTALDVNTQYNTRAHATNQYGTGYGERESFWTLANVPAAPTVDGATATSLDVTVNVNGNPVYTEFCINETSTSKFVQNDGTLGAFPFSQTGTQWGTITVNGLTTGLTYTFKIQAYNGADVATVFGDGTQGTPVAAPTVTTQATSVIAATTATGNGTITNTNGENASNRGVIWYPYSNTDKQIGDVGVTDADESGSFIAEAFTALFTGLDVNTRYNTRAHAANQYGTGYGNRESFWTLANVPAAPTVDGATATSLDVTVNENSNPASTEFCIYETSNAKFVQANGTLNTSEVWQTAVAWGTITLNGLSTGVTYTFKVKARNGDNVETAYGSEASATTCQNPGNGGTIAVAQTICYGSTPNSLSSISEASGFGGTLEYKWQLSTTDAASGFSDISSSNSSTLTPGSLNVSTWYKRLARVDCKSDWANAAESNVVEITIEELAISGTLAKTPNAANVCDGENVSATLTAGSGGNGVDELESRTNDGTSWSSWTTYTSGNNISTTGKTNVEIRTRRTADYCNHASYTTLSWGVWALPEVTCPSNQFVCIDGAPIDLTLLGATPALGTFSGTSVSNSNFYPATAGAGTHPINYSYTDANGCTDDCVFDITVSPLAFVDAGVDASICETGYLLNPTVNYEDIITWTSYGDGTFDDPYIEGAYYTPGPGDLAAGSVILELVATPVNDPPCINLTSDQITLAIMQALPTVSIGNDVTICESDAYTFAPVVANSQAVLWTTFGDGSFDNKYIEGATYTPGTGDIAAGFIHIKLDAAPFSPCVNIINDDMFIYLTPEPSVAPGNDATICETGSHTITGFSVTDYSSLSWTGGDGTFDDASLLNATYTPGPADKSSGSVQLCLTANSNAPCTGADQACMTLTFQNEPMAIAGCAGFPAKVCAGSSIQLCGTGLYYSSSEWLGGVGTFSSRTADNPTYTPAASEYGDTITFTLVVYPESPCAMPDSNITYLIVQENPTADAGDNTSICYSETYTLADASATDYSSVSWATNGGGTFDNSASLNPVYTPSQSDISAGSVDLTLTVSATSPCTQQATSTMTLTIHPEPAVIFHENSNPFYSGATMYYCADDNITVSLGQVLSGTGPFTIEWTENGNAQGPVTVNLNDNLFSGTKAAGTYDIQITKIADIFGCEPADYTPYNASFVVKPMPTITSVDPSSAEICDGEAVSFSVSGLLDGVTIFSYTIDDGVNPAFTGTETVTVAGGMHTFAAAVYPVGTYAITINSIELDGCASQFGNTMMTSFTVHALPVVTCPPSQDVCIDLTSLDLSLLGATPAGGTFSGTSVSCDIFDPSTAGIVAHTINYSFTDGNGCTNDCDFTITVHALPVVVCPPNQEICVDAAPLDLTTLGATPAAGSFSGTFVSNDTFDPASAGAGIHSVTYTYTDGFGCENSCTFNITVNDLPVAGISSNAAICLGDDLDLDAMPTGMMSYKWTGPNAWTSNLQMNTITPTVIDYVGDPYYLTVTDANGCSGTASLDVLVGDPQLDLSTDPSLTIVNNEVFVMYPVAMDIWANVPNQVNPTYLWDYNNAMAPFITINDYGTYNVTVTDMGCEVAASLTVNEKQDIQLRQGWGIFSTYINTAASFDALMADLVLTNNVVVKDEDGNVFISYNGAYSNGLANHTMGEGYQYYMSTPNQVLTVVGGAIDPATTTLGLDLGYNFMGYLRRTSAPVVQMMAPIASNIDIMKNEDGQVYWYVPSLGIWINQIGDLWPGKGYQLKLLADASFTYPENTVPFSKSDIYVAKPSYFAAPVSTGSNMTLGIPEKAWNIAVNVGDEVGVFNQNGDLVGSGVYDNDNMAISLWGDNETTNQTNGLAEKEIFTLQKWNIQSGTRETLVVTEWVEGNGTYGENDIAIVGKLAVVEESGLSLSNYPNPFKDVTTIEFSIPEDGNIRIELYNSNGKRLEVITDREYTAGTHEVQFSSTKLAMGSYFIQLESNGQTINKAVQIMK